MDFLSVTFVLVLFFFFFSSRRRHTRFDCDWSSDVCSSDLFSQIILAAAYHGAGRLADALAVYERALAISGRHPWGAAGPADVYAGARSEEHPSALQSQANIAIRPLL